MKNYNRNTPELKKDYEEFIGNKVKWYHCAWCKKSYYTKEGETTCALSCQREYQLKNGFIKL